MKSERKTIWAVLVVGLGICISWPFRRGPAVVAPLADAAASASSRLRLQLHDDVSLNLPAARSSSPILFDDQRGSDRYDAAESFDAPEGERVGGERADERVRARTVVVRADEASNEASNDVKAESQSDRKTSVGPPSETVVEKNADDETADIAPPQGRIRGLRTLGASP